MKDLFNYTINLLSEIYTLVQDINVFQRILDEKKKSLLTKEKLQNAEKELIKKVFFLRILEQISYLDDYKNDINRAIVHLDKFVAEKKYTLESVKKIGIYLSTICQEYESNAKEVIAVNSSSIQCQVIEKLEVSMKTVEIILLSFYGLTASIDDLEGKLINSVEDLLTLDLKSLKEEEKALLEEFFQHIQNAFNQKSVDAWEQTFIKCTQIINTLKTLAGIKISSNEDNSIEFIADPEAEKQDDDDKKNDDKKNDDKKNDDKES